MKGLRPQPARGTPRRRGRGGWCGCREPHPWCVVGGVPGGGGGECVAERGRGRGGAGCARGGGNWLSRGASRTTSDAGGGVVSGEGSRASGLHLALTVPATATATAREALGVHPSAALGLPSR